MKTLSDILVEANATLDLDATAPSGTELTTRTNYADQAVWDAAAMGQLNEFKSEFLSTTSTLATIPLPSGFRELMDDPRIATSSGWESWEAIEVEQKYTKGSQDRYCYILGNPSSGYSLIFNQIVASGSLSIIYQRFPSGLQTLTDTCELSDPQYVVRKIESYVLYSRSDDRFPIAEQRAGSALANMVGRGMKGTTGGPRQTGMNFRNPLR